MNSQVSLITIAALAVLSVSSQAQNERRETASLRSFFASEGFAGAPLHRRFGNHLFASCTINGKRAALMIDTGSPHTLIDRNSARRLGLSVEDTNANVGRVFGWTREHFGLSELKSLGMGNCVLTRVPVTVADESEINSYGAASHLDGLFGAHEMLKFGMVIDCARQMLYVNPRSSQARTSEKLASVLAGRGFTRVPLRLTSNQHFAADGFINGRAARLLIDTGIGTTLISKASAITSQIGYRRRRRAPRDDSSEPKHVAVEQMKELIIGGFKIDNADVAIAEIAPQLRDGLIGQEYLTWNFAVIDVGGMALYLRHPDPR